MSYSEYYNYKTFEKQLKRLYLCSSGDKMTGNLDMDCNNINSVNEIIFCNGNTFDGSFNISGNFLLNTGDTMTGNLDMCGNNVLNVSSISFFDISTNLEFSDFSGNAQNVTLVPSILDQPISLERKTIFLDENLNVDISGSYDISFNNPLANQLNLGISNETIIQRNSDISGQYIEMYFNFDISGTEGTFIELDISGVDGSFSEIIDTQRINKDNISYYLTFGPHIIMPQELTNTNDFKFILSSTDPVNPNNPIQAILSRYKIVFKSYYL